MPLQVSQDYNADTITIDGVVYSTPVFQILAKPDPKRMYVFFRHPNAGAVSIRYVGDLPPGRAEHGGDWLSRLQIEKEDLADRLGRLDTFRQIDAYRALDVPDRELLSQQAALMAALLTVLEARIDLAKK